jgi:hypothetical protein
MTTANLLDRQDTLTTRKMFDLGDRAAPISIFPSADASTIISAIFSRRVVVGKGKLTSFCCRSKKKKNPYGVSPPLPPSLFVFCDSIIRRLKKCCLLFAKVNGHVWRATPFLSERANNNNSRRKYTSLRIPLSLGCKFTKCARSFSFKKREKKGPPHL